MSCANSDISVYHKYDFYMLGFKQMHSQAHFFIAEHAAKVFTTQYFLLSRFWVVFLFGFLFLVWVCCLVFFFLLLINKANPVLLVYPQGILLLQLFS